MSNLDAFNRAGDYALCATLTSAGGALVGTGVSTLWAGGGGVVPLTVGMASLLAAGAACTGDIEVNTNDDFITYVGGCSEVDGSGTLQLNSKYQDDWQIWPGVNEGALGATKIVDIKKTGEGSQTYITVSWEGQNGTGFNETIGPADFSETAPQWRINPDEGSSCVRNPGDPTPLPPSTGDPIPYTDPDTGCTLNVTLQGFVQASEGGPAAPVWLMEGAPTLRASGGLVGGCNFSPTIVYSPPGGSGGGGGDGPVQLPVPPGGGGGGSDDEPWWKEPLIAALAGAAGALAAQALTELFEREYEEASFELVAPCDRNEEGNPATYLQEFPKQKYQDRVLAHQVATFNLLQQHLNWKTPTCGNDKPNLEGDFRTISFRSDETSPYGKSRLRKRLRYRSTSGFGLSEVVDHWAGFTFEAGPVCVIHSGSTWGTPQVWAATADEGKRVIRHAGGEAGIDPDQVGRWTVSGSDSSRVGVSGTMRVDTTGGFYWITARDGSNSRPVVAGT